MKRRRGSSLRTFSVHCYCIKTTRRLTVFVRAASLPKARMIALMTAWRSGLTLRRSNIQILRAPGYDHLKLPPGRCLLEEHIEAIDKELKRRAQGPEDPDQSELTN